VIHSGFVAVVNLIDSTMQKPYQLAILRKRKGREGEIRGMGTCNKSRVMRIPKNPPLESIK